MEALLTRPRNKSGKLKTPRERSLTMTDPGDLATTDSNVSSELPNATPTTVNPGLGDEGDSQTVHQNELDQARIMQTPDPRDER